MKNFFNGMILMVSLTVFLTACSKRSTANHELRTTNLVYNGNFELGATTPEGWHTYNQFLNDITGWATDEFHSGKHSLKIENVGGSNVYWQGNPIILEKPISAFTISMWTKTKNIKVNEGSLLLSLEVFFKNTDRKLTKKIIYISAELGNHDWALTKGLALFDEMIIKIVPKIIFAGGKGTVWIDDISIDPISYSISKKPLFDSNKNKITIEDCTSDLSTDGITTYRIEGSKELLCSDFIPIDESKTYKLSGEFKTLGNVEKLFFGVIPYMDKSSYVRNNQTVNYIKGTNTELTKSCKFTDTVVFINNGENWVQGTDKCIAFNTDFSGEYKDLPNACTSELGIQKISRLDGYWEVELTKPIGKEYARGTKIREHQLKPKYISFVSKILLPSSNFTKFDASLCQYNVDMVYPQALYPKSKYVKIILKTRGIGTLLARNIKLEEISYK